MFYRNFTNNPDETLAVGGSLPQNQKRILDRKATVISIPQRRFGEKVSDITTNWSHWFAKNFQKYSENESSLPIDQHMLIALIAPRPVYVASASKDYWADPRGAVSYTHLTLPTKRIV